MSTLKTPVLGEKMVESVILSREIKILINVQKEFVCVNRRDYIYNWKHIHFSTDNCTVYSEAAILHIPVNKQAAIQIKAALR